LLLLVVVWVAVVVWVVVWVVVVVVVWVVVVIVVVVSCSIIIAFIYQWSKFFRFFDTKKVFVTNKIRWRQKNF